MPQEFQQIEIDKGNGVVDSIEVPAGLPHEQIASIIQKHAADNAPKEDKWSRARDLGTFGLNKSKGGLSSLIDEAPHILRNATPPIVGGWAGSGLGTAAAIAMGQPELVPTLSKYGGMAGTALGGAAGSLWDQYHNIKSGEQTEIDPVQVGINTVLPFLPELKLGESIGSSTLRNVLPEGSKGLADAFKLMPDALKRGFVRGAENAVVSPAITTVSAALHGRSPTGDELKGSAKLGGGIGFLGGLLTRGAHPADEMTLERMVPKLNNIEMIKDATGADLTPLAGSLTGSKGLQTVEDALRAGNVSSSVMNREVGIPKLKEIRKASSGLMGEMNAPESQITDLHNSTKNIIKNAENESKSNIEGAFKIGHEASANAKGIYPSNFLNSINEVRKQFAANEKGKDVDREMTSIEKSYSPDIKPRSISIGSRRYTPEEIMALPESPLKKAALEEAGLVKQSVTQSLSELQNQREYLNSRITEVGADTRAGQQFMKLKEGLDKDFENASKSDDPAVADAANKMILANNLVAKEKAKLNSSIANKVKESNDSYTAVNELEKAIKRADYDEIVKFKDVVGEDQFNKIKANLMADKIYGPIKESLDALGAGNTKAKPTRMYETYLKYMPDARTRQLVFGEKGDILAKALSEALPDMHDAILSAGDKKLSMRGEFAMGNIPGIGKKIVRKLLGQKAIAEIYTNPMVQKQIIDAYKNGKSSTVASKILKTIIAREAQKKDMENK